MNIIKQSDNEFIAELEYRKAHWWEKLYISIRWWIRDIRFKCAKCEYYHYENNTCQSKKCCTGLEGYVTWFDKIFCKSYEYTRKYFSFCEEMDKKYGSYKKYLELKDKNKGDD